MRGIRTVVLAGALALGGALLVPPMPAQATRPVTLPAAATRVVAVDVDGDTVADTVSVEQSAPSTYVVNVVTAAGADDVATITSTIEADWGIEPWLGAARLDRVKGYELLVATSGGDGLMFRVLTWRSGELVKQRAPRTLMKGAYDWYVASLDFARFGYRFTTVDGRRYVRDFELYPNGSRWEGTIVKSVWKRGAWQKVSTKRVNLSAAQAQAYNGIGATLVATP